MRRLHLFELEDQPWCPAVLRNAVTGYLRLVVAMTRQLKPVVPAIADLLERSGETSILDLCSGSGAVAGQLVEGLSRRGRPTPVTLTDLYPHAASFGDVARGREDRIDWRPQPLDARRVPAEVPGLRTMFNAFHHFRPHEAREVLAAAAESGRPIAIIEFIERGLFPLTGVFFSPFLILLLAPFLRPFRWSTLFFVYVVPLVPLMIFWDGLVSWLRVYSVEDLRELAASAAAPGYAWEAGRWRTGPVRVTYLVGLRKPAS